MSRITPDGALVACADDRGASALLRQALDSGRRSLAYGLARRLGQREPQVLASEMAPNLRGGFDFRAQVVGVKAMVKLQVPGQHNVLNALAALGVAHLLDLPSSGLPGY